MKQRNKDRQTDRRLRRGNGHHEKDKDEPVKLMELPRVGQKGQVNGVHHQLDRHENRDAVSASQHTAHADGEKNRAQDQEPLRRNHSTCTPRPLKTKAPTIAASNRMETISNGKMYASNSFTPTVRASAMNGPDGSSVTAYFAR